MDIRNFITFNTIVEKKGFTLAAQSLNYSQSTVSIQIKELENHYKTPLFDRIGKKIVLTSFGQELYNQSKNITTLYENMLNMNPQGQSNEVIRIGVYDSLLNYRLYNVIHAFKKEHPNVKLVITNGVPKDLRDLVRKGELDVIFQVEPTRSFTDLVVTSLCEEKFKLILPNDEPLDFINKEHQQVFLTEKNCSYRGIFEKFLDEQGISKEQALETGSVDLIKQYVGFGMGFALVPAFALESEKEKNTLNTYDLNIPQMFTQYVYHKKKHISPIMQAFINIVKDFSKGWK